MLQCPKCKRIQEERKTSYQEHQALIRQSGGHPYTCGGDNCNHIEMESLENIKEMRERHENEIDELQKSCPHPTSEISDWIGVEWAPGHSCDYSVKVCEICEKEVDRMVHCHECHKQMTNYEWISGGGENFCFGNYCKQCWDKIPEPKKKMGGIKNGTSE